MASSAQKPTKRAVVVVGKVSTGRLSFGLSGRVVRSPMAIGRGSTILPPSAASMVRSSVVPPMSASVVDVEISCEVCDAGSRYLTPLCSTMEYLQDLEKDWVIPNPVGDKRAILASHLLHDMAFPPSEFFCEVLDTMVCSDII